MKSTSGIAPTRDVSGPTFEITIDGTVLPVVVALKIGRLRVDEDAGLPSMFTLEIVGGDDSGETSIIDGSLFGLGATVEIKLGYEGVLNSVLTAEITGIEPVFTHDGLPLLVVRGYDKRHRLLRGRKTRSFVQQKDSDIASLIAAEVGLTIAATDSEVSHDYVLQANQTNMEFLSERARLIEYEVVIESGTLHFRPMQNAQGEALTLTPQDELLEFRPRLSTLGQITQLQLRGWDPKDKKAIVAQAGEGDEVSTMGGADTGAALVRTAFGDAELVVTDRPVLTQAEADQQIRARFNKALLELIVAEGICVGRTDLKPGQVIKIDGVGTRFSGQYYVTATSHRYSLHRPYQTHFVARRNAV